MEAELWRIVWKPNDYKICRQCGAINRYENEVCWDCMFTTRPTFTEVGGEEVIQWINQELNRIDSEENQNNDIKYDDETLYNV